MSSKQLLLSLEYESSGFARATPLREAAHSVPSDRTVVDPVVAIAAEQATLKHSSPKKKRNRRHSEAGESAAFPRGRLVLTVAEVAARYGVSRPTVWRWVSSAEGFPAPVKIGPGTTRWYIDDLTAYDVRVKSRVQTGGGK